MPKGIPQATYKPVHCSPVKVEHRIVVSGGHLGKKKFWVPEVIKVPDHPGDFITLDRWGDRSLACAMGMDMASTHPLENAQSFKLIVRLRDEKVDTLIFEHKQKNDPMSDGTVVSGTHKGPGREKDFQAAVPNVIEIVLPTLVTDNGSRLAEFSLSVVSTPRRGVSPTVLFSAELLTWLTNVRDMELDIVQDSEKADNLAYFQQVDLPDLPPPLKYRKRAGSLSVACQYTNQDGKKQSHQETVTRIRLNMAELEVVLQTIIKNVQDFLAKNDFTNHDDHVPLEDARDEGPNDEVPRADEVP
jgi:hypothetical protein